MEGSDQPQDMVKFPVCSGASYRLQVWLDAAEPGAPFSEPVKITEGQTSEVVDFQVAVDCRGIDFEPRHHALTVSPGEASGRVTFGFTVPEVEDDQEVEIWVELFQERRLIQSLLLTAFIQPQDEPSDE